MFLQQLRQVLLRMSFFEKSDCIVTYDEGADFDKLASKLNLVQRPTES